MSIKFWLENLKGREYLEDLGIDGRVIVWFIPAKGLLSSISIHLFKLKYFNICLSVCMI
jgi:hypothetical protein